MCLTVYFVGNTSRLHYIHQLVNAERKELRS